LNSMVTSSTSSQRLFKEKPMC